MTEFSVYTSPSIFFWNPFQALEYLAEFFWKTFKVMEWLYNFSIEFLSCSCSVSVQNGITSENVWYFRICFSDFLGWAAAEKMKKRCWNWSCIFHLQALEFKAQLMKIKMYEKRLLLQRLDYALWPKLFFFWSNQGKNVCRKKIAVFFVWVLIQVIRTLYGRKIKVVGILFLFLFFTSAGIWQCSRHYILPRYVCVSECSIP